jgi:hypothetical protein
MGRKARKGRGSSGGGRQGKVGRGSGRRQVMRTGGRDTVNDPDNPNSAVSGLNYLNYLNRSLAFHVLFYLSSEEKIKLGEAYPRFQVQKQQQQSQDKNKILAHASDSNPDELEGGSSTIGTRTITLAIPDDPHTLLARLNSRRLHRRMCYLRKNYPNFNMKGAYVFNKSSEQIAISEWQGLMTEYKTKKLLHFDMDSTTKDNDRNDQRTASLLPSPLELLLFSPCPRAVAVLASYPRSGNSLLRTLYERTTLRVTGSDMRGGLTQHDLVGEAATENNAVQFVKTHFPERRGHPPFLVNRAVLLVRNPYDAIESYFNLMMTNTHTTSISEDQRKRNVQVFAQMALKEIQVWRDFHEFWLQQGIPLLVIRYEDLIRYTDKVISNVIRFVLEVNNMDFFEERIRRCIQEEQIEKLGSYRPRSGGIGKSLATGMYTPELLTKINHSILDTMIKFGYDEMIIPAPDE